MSASETYRKIGELLPLLGSIDDKQVGRALDQIDSLLSAASLTWADVGDRVAKPPVAADPRRNGAAPGAPGQAGPSPTTPRGTGARPPSQWAIDREDITTLFTHISENGAPNSFVEQFAASVYDWVVGQGRGISERQREILHEKLDQLGL